ncbi:hypothetical protein Tco_1165471 [Tanacetum coccineum]
MFSIIFVVVVGGSGGGSDVIIIGGCGGGGGRSVIFIVFVSCGDNVLVGGCVGDIVIVVRGGGGDIVIIFLGGGGCSVIVGVGGGGDILIVVVDGGGIIVIIVGGGDGAIVIVVDGRVIVIVVIGGDGSDVIVLIDGDEAQEDKMKKEEEEMAYVSLDIVGIVIVIPTTFTIGVLQCEREKVISYASAVKDHEKNYILISDLSSSVPLLKIWTALSVYRSTKPDNIKSDDVGGFADLRMLNIPEVIRTEKSWKPRYGRNLCSHGALFTCYGDLRLVIMRTICPTNQRSRFETSETSGFVGTTEIPHGRGTIQTMDFVTKLLSPHRHKGCNLEALSGRNRSFRLFVGLRDASRSMIGKKKELRDLKRKRMELKLEDKVMLKVFALGKGLYVLANEGN